MRTPLRRSIAQVLKIARARGRSLRQRICLTLTASRADLLKTLAQSQPGSYGLVTRFSPSHIAQFCRDWTAMLGYRSADQNGGSARVLPDLVHHSASPSIDVVGAA